MVEITSTWQYHVAKEDLGTAWRAPDYDDSAWASGGGLLYVENSELPAPKTTALPLTPHQLPTTTYFRTRFTLDLATGGVLGVVAHTVIDDGAVVYLNGEEVFRLRMPDGDPTYDTHAARSVGNAQWEGPFDIPVTKLRDGVNVLAVEVHQINATSSDVVLGMTLDVIGQPHDADPPVIARLFPERGAAVASLMQLEVWFNEWVKGVDAGDLLVNGVPATEVTELAPDHYRFQFPQPDAGTVTVSWAPDPGITDFSTLANPFGGGEFKYELDPTSFVTRLDFLEVSQSSDASPAQAAGKAVDGKEATFSRTADQPGSWWQGRWGRPYPLDRIVVVPPPDPAALEGVVLRLFNLDDQKVFETTLSNPGPSAVAVVSLPEGTVARTVWFGLPGDRVNGAGRRQVALAEVRPFGAPNIPHAPDPYVPPGAQKPVRVWQSSEYPDSRFPASNAIDGNLDNFTHTDDLENSYWMAWLGQEMPVERIEVVNRKSCCDTRLEGLTLRLFDGNSNSVDSVVLTNPGLGKTWSYTPPANTRALFVRIGLENGAKNGDDNYYVSLAEVRVFSRGVNVLRTDSDAPVPVFANLASFKHSYMLRLNETVRPAGNANDDDMSTETKTTSRTVDAYWEVDLGETHALYGVRLVAASDIGGRLTNTVVRLFDADHRSVHVQPVTGQPPVFDVDLNGPHLARYVRVGLENKQRTDPSGGIEWYIGFREVEVFGRDADAVGVQAFTASATDVGAGEPVTLAWSVEDVHRVELHPGLGSVGAQTDADGAGRLEVTVTEPTEFILVATNATGRFSRAVEVGVGGRHLSVRLSELVADNKYALKDGYGDSPDWIELRNSGNEPVSLAGWGLSDDPDQPMKWTFPDVTLAPHAMLVVFADGRGGPADPRGCLHAGFALGDGGGTVLLTDPDGTTERDRVDYPALDTDLAYARDLEGAWTFMEPTPDAVNAAPVYQGWLKPVKWSHPRGFCDAPFTLTLTNPNPDAELYYSLDGSEPDRLYAGPLTVDGTTVVRAQVRRAGYRPPRVQTRTFLFIDDVITSSVMRRNITQDPRYSSRLRKGLLALPTISLTVPGGQPDYPEEEGSLEILWPDGRQPVQINCGISRFGNAWTKFQKRSFRIKCRARYGWARLKAPLFDGFDHGIQAARSFDKLDLRSGSQDMSQRGFYMAGRFVEDSMLDMGSLNPHGRFVHVYINGVYWGQYDCRELLEEHFLASYLGGDDEDYVTVNGNDNVGSDFVIGAPDPPNLAPWETARSVQGSYQQLRAWVDIAHLTDFMLLWFYGNCESEFRACGPIEPGSGFKFWIADADGFLRTSALGKNRTSRNGPGGFFGSLRREGDPDFRMLVADRIYRHFFNHGALTPEANLARLNARMEEIQDSLIVECARWGIRTPSNWEDAADTIRTRLFPARTAELLRYLRRAGLYPDFDPPACHPFGGVVAAGFQPSITAASGTIYYTLDGSDPRLPGGGVSPDAHVWHPGAVTVTDELTLNLRLRTADGRWSALAQPRFVVSPPRVPTPRDLLVSEIHYNPAGSDDFEFVELWNAAAYPLDLSGVSLNDAVRFLFPNGFTLAPGAFVLVVEDPVAFAARYQTPGAPDYMPDLVVAGKWSGALANEGETLVLQAADGTVLSAIPFKPSGDWPARADGRGSSLELIPPPADATDAEAQAWVADGRNWRASVRYHGTPGRFDDFTGAVRINELAFDDGETPGWIELYNAGDQPANLGGVALTDDLDQPARWVFPENTELAGGGFLRVPTDELGFSFRPAGESAYLLERDGDRVIRFLDSVTWADMPRDLTLVRHLRGDGRLDFTPARAATPEAPNALPQVGPVVISEIQFAPAGEKAAFVELANLSAEPVPLFDPQHPTNTWRLAGVGGFTFPADTTLAPCGTLIVCATEPAAFRAQYGLDDSVPVFGPWDGALDPDGERLKLLRPGAPKESGKTPWILEDAVAYRIHAPWPATPDGGSLERVPLAAYGNDPASWRAAPAPGTPGARPENRPPELELLGATTVPSGVPATWTVRVNDPDLPWQPVRVTADQLPPDGVFDPETGTLAWTPPTTAVGREFLLRFTATDGPACGALTTETEFTIRVAGPLTLTARYGDGRIHLSFVARHGRRYRVEYCTDLGRPDWRPLRDITPGQDGEVTVDDNAPTDAARFYRVQWDQGGAF